MWDHEAGQRMNQGSQNWLRILTYSLSIQLKIVVTDFKLPVSFPQHSECIKVQWALNTLGLPKAGAPSPGSTADVSHSKIVPEALEYPVADIQTSFKHKGYPSCKTLWIL